MVNAKVKNVVVIGGNFFMQAVNHYSFCIAPRVFSVSASRYKGNSLNIVISDTKTTLGLVVNRSIV